MSWKVKIDVNGQFNDCLLVCNVKMKRILQGQKLTETHFQEFLDFGAIASSDLNLF